MSAISRRSALTAGAAALASGTAVNVTALAVAKVAHPDAELLALSLELKTTHSAAIGILPRLHDAHEIYQASKEQRPPQPEICRWRKSDYESLGLFSDGFFNANDVERLRQLGPEHVIFETVDGVLQPGELEVIRRVTRPTDLKRAAEIIKAFDEWNAGNPTEGEAEYDGLQEEFDCANGAVCDLENRIAAIPATTIDGLRIKAITALMYEGSDHSIDEMLQEGRPEHDDSWGAADVLFQLAWDIIEMTTNRKDAARFGA